MGLRMNIFSMTNIAPCQMTSETVGNQKMMEFYNIVAQFLKNVLKVHCQENLRRLNDIYI